MILWFWRFSILALSDTVLICRHRLGANFCHLGLVNSEITLNCLVPDFSVLYMRSTKRRPQQVESGWMSRSLSVARMCRMAK